MYKLLRIAIVLTLFGFLTGMAFAGNDILINKNAAKVFASLPDGVGYPEGITGHC